MDTTFFLLETNSLHFPDCRGKYLANTVCKLLSDYRALQVACPVTLCNRR